MTDELKQWEYDRGYAKGRADGYSQAENDYHTQSEKDRQSSYDCGYQKGKADAIEEYKTNVINKINFEDKWLFACKSNNADTNIAFGALRAFCINKAEQMQKGAENDRED